MANSLTGTKEDKIETYKTGQMVAFLDMLGDESLDFNDPIVFSRLLTIAVNEHSVSRKYLAGELGVDLSQISRWMKGKTKTHKGMAKYAIFLIESEVRKNLQKCEQEAVSNSVHVHA